MVQRGADGCRWMWVVSRLAHRRHRRRELQFRPRRRRRTRHQHGVKEGVFAWSRKLSRVLRPPARHAVGSSAEPKSAGPQRRQRRHVMWMHPRVRRRTGGYRAGSPRVHEPLVMVVMVHVGVVVHVMRHGCVVRVQRGVEVWMHGGRVPARAHGRPEAPCAAEAASAGLACGVQWLHHIGHDTTQR